MELTALFEQGARAFSQKNLTLAADRFEKALSMDPNREEILYNLGVIYHQMGSLDKAVGFYGRAVEINPRFVAALFNLGNALTDLNRIDSAVQTYHQVLAVEPGHPETLYNLGNLAQTAGDAKQALICYRNVLAVDPGHIQALNNMGVIFRDNDQLEEAQACFEKVLALCPKFVPAHYNLGVIAQKNGDYHGGLACFKTALKHDPDYMPARWLYYLSLPMFYDSAGEIEAARRRFTENLDYIIQSTPLEAPQQKRRALEGIASTTHFYLQYQGGNDVDLQKKYGAFVCRVLAANFPDLAESISVPDRKPGERIRIGYVSSLMFGHTIGVFLLGWLENSDRRQFEISCYHVGSRTDALTGKIVRTVDHFHHLPGNVETAARKIKSDRLHLLVHTDVGMNPVTLQLAGLRLAPVQCKGWGHPVTTGLPTVKYYLSSDLMEPQDAQSCYTETLIRLPGLALCHQPPDLPETPKTRLDLGLPENKVIYLSTQSLFKYLPQYDWVFTEIARKVPQSCFVFLANQSEKATRRFYDRLTVAFERAGLRAQAHCIVLPRLCHEDFLSLNMVADLLLDTFVWSGGKTSLEAIACGLPVLTCPGGLMRGRHAYAMLKMMDMHELIADDEAEYCRIAADLGTNLKKLTTIKNKINLQRRRLYDDKPFMHALETFYRQAIRPNHRTGSSGANDSANDPEEPAVSSRTSGATEQTKAAAEHLYNDGVAFYQAGHFEFAAEKFEGALSIRPLWKKALFNLAMSREALKQPDEAERLYRQILHLQPDDAKTAYNLGTLLLEQKKPREAVKIFHHLVGYCPNMATAQNNLGKALMACSRLDEAYNALRKAVEVDPGLFPAWFNLGELCQRMELFEEAIAHYKKALEINPNAGEAHNNMGNAYRAEKRYDQAAACYKRVVALDPKRPEGYYNLGSVQRLQEQYGDAFKNLMLAIERNPGYADAWNNLALTCKNIGQLERSLACFNRALAINPNLDVARWNRSFVHLLKGDYLNGWLDFECRFRIPAWKTLYPFKLAGARWNGELQPNATILVHDEQGLGDTFQFIRYLPLVKRRCKRVVFETRPSLAGLLSANQAADTIVPRTDMPQPENTYDYQVPLLSLPAIFQTTPDRIPEKVPYIRADAEKTLNWAGNLPGSAMKIGLVWAGRPEHTNDHNRSCSLRDLTPLFEVPDTQFIALQKGPAAEQIKAVNPPPNLIDLGGRLADFSDTAAVIQNLDLVISVDTAVVHLAGAMGKPVWVLIPFIPDWRWEMHREDSPWYPSMRLFRQTIPKDWKTVITGVKRKLLYLNKK